MRYMRYLGVFLFILACIAMWFWTAKYGTSCDIVATVCHYSAGARLQSMGIGIAAVAGILLFAISWISEEVCALLVARRHWR